MAEVLFVEGQSQQLLWSGDSCRNVQRRGKDTHTFNMCLMVFTLPPHHSLNIGLRNLWRSEEKNMKPPQEAAGGGRPPGSERPRRASRLSTCNFPISHVLHGYYQFMSSNRTKWTFKCPRRATASCRHIFKKNQPTMTNTIMKYYFTKCF